MRILVLVLVVILSSWLIRDNFLSINNKKNIEIKEIKSYFFNQDNEIDSSMMNKRENESSPFLNNIEIKVDAGEDINVTLESNIELQVKVDKKDNYVYLWTEGQKRVGTGEKLIKKFPLGEHHLQVQLFKNNKIIGKDEVVVTVWRYLREEHLYFDIDTESYVLNMIKILNHLHQTIFEFNDYYKKTFIYNEFGSLIEESYEDLNTPTSNYTILNTYDENNHLRVYEKIDFENKILQRDSYDKNNQKIVDTKEKNKDVIESDNYDIVTNKEIRNRDGNLIYVQLFIDNEEYINRFKYQNNKIIYKETLTPKGKNYTEFRYNQDEKVVLIDNIYENSEGLVLNRYKNRIVYDENRNKIEEEIVRERNEEVVKHILLKWEYEAGNNISETVEALVGFCPYTTNIIKEKTFYFYDENNTLLSSRYKYQKEDDDELKDFKKNKIIQTYTNFLE